MYVPSRNCTLAIAACLLLMVTIVATTPLRGQVQKDASSSPVDLKEGQTPEEVEKMLGKPDDLTKINEDLIYTYPTLKLYFERGKLVNVEQRPAQPQAAEPMEGVLINDDIMKMVQAKLGDSVIISTIKTSPSRFDTGVDGMVKLKTAGVSDAVIQAMRDVQEAAKSAAQSDSANPPSVDALTFSSLSQYLTRRWPDRIQCPPQSITRLLQRLQSAGYSTITELNTALNNASEELARKEAGEGVVAGGSYRPCGLVTATLQATDQKFSAAHEQPATTAGPQAALHNGNPALMLPTESGRTFPVELVDRNGERALRLRVHHNQLSTCIGYLYISRNRIAYDPLETPIQKDAFDLQRSEIKKAAISHCTIGSCTSVGVSTEKKNYYFFPLFDLGADSKSGVREALQDRVRDQPVYDFIGRSLSDFDNVLREAEQLVANLGPPSKDQKQVQSATNPPAEAPANAPRRELKEGQTPQEVEAVLSNPEDTTKVKDTLIYIYPTVKVFFKDGKLVNVEERKK